MRTDINSLLKRMSKAGTKEATRKVNSLQLGTDFDTIMPHTQTEMETIQQDLATAQQKIGQAYDQDVFFMKSLSTVAGYVSLILCGCLSWIY